MGSRGTKSLWRRASARACRSHALFEALERMEPRLMLSANWDGTTNQDLLMYYPGTGADILQALPDGMAGQWTDDGLEINPVAQSGVYVPHYIMLDSSPQVTTSGDLAPFASSTPTG